MAVSFNIPTFFTAGAVTRLLSLALLVFPGWAIAQKPATNAPETATSSKDLKAELPCRFISFEQDRKEPTTAEIAWKLNGIGPEISVKAVNGSSLFACAGPNSIDNLVSAINQLAGVKKAPAANIPESHDARLYFNRNATLLADAIGTVFPNVGVKALGEDLLIFQGNDRADEENIRELKRRIALLDTPRPEITLNVWSAQVSGTKEEDVESASRAIRTSVSIYNDQLTKAFQRGWMYLNSVRYPEDFAVPHFGEYVLRTYEADANTYNADKRDKHFCGNFTYCLGYAPTYDALMQPTLSNFIGLLASAKDQNIIPIFVDCLEGRRTCKIDQPHENTSDSLPEPLIKLAKEAATSDVDGSCEVQDESQYGGNGDTIPVFNCFRRELVNALATKQRLSMLRGAMADFLFQYKYSLQYPHSFRPIEYAASAQVLDAQLNPLLSAFNRDIAAYLHSLQDVTTNKFNDKKSRTKFISNGIVTLRTISGVSASVDSVTQNAFRETPQPLAQEFAQNLTKAEASLPAALSANLGTHGAAALSAFLNSGKSPTVSVGKDLNLRITSASLQGASSAELAVHLEAKDEDKPQRIKPDGTAQNDTTDRVANHTVDTVIRVDSLGLFEISTLSAELSRAREPIPLLPPFVELPYIGSFLQFKPRPSTVSHRSLVILSATILPTSADLLNGMRFEHDRFQSKSITEATNQQQDQTAVYARRVHKKMLACIADEADPPSKKADPHPCDNPAELPQAITASNR